MLFSLWLGLWSLSFTWSRSSELGLPTQVHRYSESQTLFAVQTASASLCRIWWSRSFMPKISRTCLLSTEYSCSLTLFSAFCLPIPSHLPALQPHTPGMISSLAQGRRMLALRIFYLLPFLWVRVVKWFFLGHLAAYCPFSETVMRWNDRTSSQAR